MYAVRVRTRGKVELSRHDSLGDALEAVRAGVAGLERDGRVSPVGGGVLRRFDPVAQVVGRVELSGPAGLRAGVDVRGDGSSEAFSGRVRRSLIAQRDGESAYDALARSVEPGGVS